MEVGEDAEAVRKKAVSVRVKMKVLRKEVKEVDVS
jgi:hypothetical protein